MVTLHGLWDLSSLNGTQALSSGDSDVALAPGGGQGLFEE